MSNDKNDRWEYMPLEDKLDYLHRNLMGLITFANNQSVRLGEIMDRITRIENTLKSGKTELPPHK